MVRVLSLFWQATVEEQTRQETIQRLRRSVSAP